MSAPTLNALLREASSAQDAFDNWDNGITFYGGPFRVPRACSLNEVCSELDAAKLKLVNFVLENGADLIAELSA